MITSPTAVNEPEPFLSVGTKRLRVRTVPAGTSAGAVPVIVIGSPAGARCLLSEAVPPQPTTLAFMVIDAVRKALHARGVRALRLDLFLRVIVDGDDPGHVYAERALSRRAEAGLRADLPAVAEADYHAMTIGLRDYLAKSGFSKVILGLSGGIDSAICAAMAVDALGADLGWCRLVRPHRGTAPGDAEGGPDQGGLRRRRRPGHHVVQHRARPIADLFAAEIDRR